MYRKIPRYSIIKLRVTKRWRAFKNHPIWTYRIIKFILKFLKWFIIIFLIIFPILVTIVNVWIMEPLYRSNVYYPLESSDFVFLRSFFFYKLLWIFVTSLTCTLLKKYVKKKYFKVDKKNLYNIGKQKTITNMYLYMRFYGNLFSNIKIFLNHVWVSVKKVVFANTKHYLFYFLRRLKKYNNYYLSPINVMWKPIFKKWSYIGIYRTYRSKWIWRD